MKPVSVFRIAADAEGHLGVYVESHNHDSLGDRVAQLDSRHTASGWRALIKDRLGRVEGTRREKIATFCARLADEPGVRVRPLGPHDSLRPLQD